MSKNEKPKHFGVLKIIGFTGIAVAIIGGIISSNGFGKHDGSFMLGGGMACFGLFVGVVCLVYGFSPEIAKLKTKTNKYIQEQNKEDLQDIVSTGADIASEGITKTVKAVKKGLKDTKFCIACGKEIDKEAKFCSHCGKEQ